MDPTQIPDPLLNLAKKTASKPVSSFSEFIALKLFGKTNAKLRAEAENVYDKERQKGQIERDAREPFIIQLEAKKAFREYSNLGNTLLKSTPLITASESTIEDDNDVFWGLLEHAKTVSNDDMQALIAKIIAGEYNTPGTYAMSTLQILKMLGKHELTLLENLGSLMISDQQIPDKIFNLRHNATIIRIMGLDFGSFQTLQSLGIVMPNPMTRRLSNPEKKIFEVNYFDKKIHFAPPEENFEDIELPSFYSLSSAGKEIFQHLQPKYNDKIYQWLLENYEIHNYKRIT